MQESEIKDGRECGICANPYDRGGRVPTVICTHQHTICRTCLDALRIKAPHCPFCREKIDFGRICVNELLYGKLPGSGALRKCTVVYVNAPVQANQRVAIERDRPPAQPNNYVLPGQR